jgi:hypothetical protein
MSETVTVARPFVGAGDLRLGMTRSEVEAVAGKPDDVWLACEKPGDRRESWEYTSRGWSLDFDEEDDWRLVDIDLYRPQVEGLVLHGLPEEEMLAAWSEAGLSALSEDRSLREFDTGIWECEALELTLWTDEGHFDYLTVSPRWSEDRETILWPDAPAG